jgi:hypothetical protein
MLHLLARTEDVLAGALGWLAQPGFAHPAGQRAVRDGHVQLGDQQLLSTYHVALSPDEGRAHLSQRDRR